MSAPPSIIDPFHRQLHYAISEQIETREVELASGSSKNYEEYKFSVGFIQALRLVLEKCKEIELERYGGRLGADQD